MWRAGRASFAHRMARTIAVALTLSISGVAFPANGQDFKGRTITVFVPSRLDNPFYKYAQSVADELGQFIPGSPKLVLKQAPGQSALAASNFAFGSMAADGLNLYMPPPDILIQQFLRPDDARYDAAWFAWLGRSHSSNPVWMVPRESGITEVGDAEEKPITVVTGNPESLTYVIPKVVVGLLELGGVEFERDPDALASLSIPANASAILPWSTWQARSRDRSGQFLSSLRPLLQIGIESEPEFRQVPRLSDLVPLSDEPIARIFESYGTIGFALVAPPGTSTSAVSVLRQAYRRLNRDEAFIATIEKAGLRFSPTGGETLQVFVDRTVAGAPLGAADRIQELMKWSRPYPLAAAAPPSDRTGDVSAVRRPAPAPRPAFQPYGLFAAPMRDLPPAAAGNGGGRAPASRAPALVAPASRAPASREPAQAFEVPASRAPASAAAPANVAAPGGTSGAGSQATSGGFMWNSWITNYNRPDAPPVEAIEKGPDNAPGAGDTYVVNIDLAALSYKALDLGTPAPLLVNDEFLEFLRKQIALHHSRVEINYRVVAIGDEIELADDIIQGLLEINLTRLASPPSGPDVKTLIEKVRDQEEPIDALSQKVAATVLRFSIKGIKEGCGALGISFWDRDFAKPIEHLVRMVQVAGATDSSPEKCYDPKDGPLRGGLKTLLDRLIVGAKAESGHIDAALHVFEAESKAPSIADHSVVVFVDGTQRQADGLPTTYGWTTRTKLSAFLASGDLQERIDDARLKLKTDSGSYARVAEVLRDKLFTARLESESQAQEASNAKAALAAIRKKDTGPTPVLMARLLSADNEPLFLPLELLTLASPPALDPSVTVVQPLRRERYVSAKTCVRPWFIGIPTAIEGVSETTDMNALATIVGKLDAYPPDTDWLKPPITTIGNLRKYLQAIPPYPPQNTSEGIVLLAHYDTKHDKFYFTDKSNDANLLVREFRPGSIAVLTACSILDASQSNSRLVKDLNTLGVDAMIASPFSIDARFGTQFAIAFVAVLEDAKRSQTKATVADLFARTVDKVADHYARVRQPYMAKMAAELILVGDRNLSLCAN